MAGSILTFPTPVTPPPYTRPTLAEVAFHRARFGLHLYDPTSAPPSPVNSSLSLLDQANLAVTRIELGIANQANRERQRLLFAATH